MPNANTHTTVLLGEAVDALLGAAVPGAGALYVDATFGRGGHSRAILARLPASARLLAFDQDPDAVAAAASIEDARFSIRHQSFAALGELAPNSVAGVLLDLGVSSPQLDNPARGFSFRFDGPLDMRMNSAGGMTLAQWLAQASLEHITQVIRDYSEERFASSIAKAIVAQRSRSALSSTAELASLVAGVVKTREPGQHPATRTFQAFRIFINAELEQLQQALDATLKILQPGARLVVISFHSLEDRIVKRFIARHARPAFDRRAPFAAPHAVSFKALTRLRASSREIAANARARSAIMRSAERLGSAIEVQT